MHFFSTDVTPAPTNTRMNQRILGYLLVGLAGSLAAGCSSRTTELGPSGPAAGRSNAGGAGFGGSEPGAGGGLNVNPGNLGGPGNLGTNAGTHPELPGCPGCRWVDCPAGSQTSVSGVVRTPAKSNADPLYNAVVYLPSAPIEPFAATVSCEHCGTVSGKPVAATLSGVDGKFVLGGLPAGNNVPLVLQIGRWRRQVVVPEIKACTDNPMPAELTRLARNQSEGDIPAMAIASLVFDPEECILRKIGIEDSEFTVPSGPGRVHVFISGEGGTHLKGAETGPLNGALWGNAAQLKRYDVVILTTGATSGDGGQAARASMVDYANAGGRMFVTSDSSSWIEESSLRDTAVWTSGGNGTVKAEVDTSFPKGKAMSDWLTGLGATSEPGQIELRNTNWRASAVNAPAQRWLYTADPASSVQSFTFNTPLSAAPDQQCGRVAYSSYHVLPNGALNGLEFPAECDDGPLSPQERVLEFMLFDLASCVQADAQAPMAPPIIK